MTWALAWDAAKKRWEAKEPILMQTHTSLCRAALPARALTQATTGRTSTLHQRARRCAHHQTARAPCMNAGTRR